ncbi:response regulator [Cryobacterium luteum]|uniref:Response regulator transcription factor n=1 Tax=Cryobacterium luteum TaxID=1424661 RepID=A0A1H8MCM2_9MICO|nr:response regulator transcription factor [Cryobacterium luteum]TFB82528.1 response regulator transcription factor [Cryobacterium luteum]SEO15073.1 two component transcriptional regulator, LuxR family [Cryobacterium luteum]
MTIRVGLADDQPLFTAGLAMMIDGQPDMCVDWQAIDGADAIRQHRHDPVDVLLLDIQMPGMDGLTATRQLMADRAPGKIIMLTTFDTDQYVLAAVEAGASGFLLKNTPPDQLLSAIRTVHQGDAVISPSPTRRLLANFQAPPDHAGTLVDVNQPDLLSIHTLTRRENEILTLIATGLTNQEICDRLWLSMPTIKTHISNLLAKTHSRDRVHLVLFALRTGAIGLEDTLKP